MILIKFLQEIKSMTIVWAEHVANMGEMKNLYEVLVAKSERQTD
jgi:hypothetical protein